ncbi:unnamed protein product [Musa acuminata subsp. malaccensis]|uniref:(wild Malaysian banana) hypothetical protein n=1 Tax=Musa acuminata subsp. malaccensis TaxID=214687 RepID=A0A804HNX0_MUSAM|nr:PREDICTED: uncharacterized protein LOC103981876 [Musa acuminata subsp. malaccensis]CAG1858186.1 unnamed protein product [Musa acuminata subsp. malaccensis]
MAKPCKFPGTSTILWEALRIPFRNPNLILPIIILTLVSSSSSLLLLGDSLSMLFFSRPICSRVTDLFSLLAHVEGLSIPQWILLTLLFIVISLLTTATIHATAMAFTGKHPATPSDVILKTRHAWKGSLVTQICITILHLCFVLSTDPVLVGLAIISNNSKLLTLLLIVVSLLAVFYYLYIAIVLLLCLVVSAIEDECYGTEAMGRALELFSRSRKQGVVIAVLVVVVSSVATLVCEAVSSAQSDGSQLLIGFIHIGKDVVLNLVILATSTVLYYECKKCEGEQKFMEMDGHIVHASLLTDAYVDAVELP